MSNTGGYHEEAGSGDLRRSASSPGSIGSASEDAEVLARPVVDAAAVRLTRMATVSTGDPSLDTMAHAVALARLNDCYAR